MSHTHGCTIHIGEYHKYHKIHPADSHECLVDPGLLSLPVCRPCPAHTICSQGEIRGCVDSFVLEPHALSAIGLPFQPVCVPDTINLKYAEKLRREVVDYVQIRTGEKICHRATDSSTKDRADIGEYEIKRWASSRMVNLSGSVSIVRYSQSSLILLEAPARHSF